MAWIRYRFTSTHDDYRPVTFPPPGPYWCTGYDPDEHAILVAYLRPNDVVTDYWPDAIAIEGQPQDSVTYTTRFQRPQWYTGPDI
jgi:hypothetical protein